MKKELVVINGFLLVGLAGAVFQFYQGWRTFQVSHDVETVQYDGEVFAAPLVPETEGIDSSSDWSVVVEQNPFSFDRNPTAIAAPEVPVATGPLPFLLGTLSLGDGPRAFLAPGADGGSDSLPFGIGEVIDGWELVQIDAKSVVVESGGVERTIAMNDPTAIVRRGTQRTSAGAAPQVSTVQTAAPASRTQSNANRATPPAQPPATGDNVPPGFRVVRTPFGTRIVPQ